MEILVAFLTDHELASGHNKGIQSAGVDHDIADFTRLRVKDDVIDLTQLFLVGVKNLCAANVILSCIAKLVVSQVAV